MKKSISTLLLTIVIITLNTNYTNGLVLPTPIIYPPHCDTLLWSRVAGATYYRLQLFIGNTIVIDSSHIPDTFIVAHNLNFGSYSMRVRAYSSVDSGNWISYPFSIGGMPSPPTFLGYNSHVLYWSKVNMAIYYQIQIFGTIDTSQYIVFDSNHVVDTFINVSFLPGPNTYYLRIRSNNCYGNGMWSQLYNFTMPYNGIKRISNEIPDKFELFQNYPNPFNPSTKIKFDVPLSRGVPEGWGVFARLIIYDLLSRKVATLVNEKLNPGTYEVEWNGTNYPSGVYLYKLITENYTETKKLVLLK